MRSQIERGAMTAMIAVLSVFFLSMTLLVTEGGRKLSNISRAQDVASEAARAAAATIDLSSLAEGSPRIDVDGGRAEAQARAVVTDAGPNIVFVSFDVNGARTAVIVEVRVEGDSMFPGFDISGTGSHRADVIDPSTLPP